MKPNHAKIAVLATVALAIIAAAATSAGGPSRAGNNQRAISETSRRLRDDSFIAETATGNKQIAWNSNKRALAQTRKGTYEFFSIGTSDRAIASLRIPRIHKTNPHTNKSNTCHPQRPGSNRLC